MFDWLKPLTAGKKLPPAQPVLPVEGVKQWMKSGFEAFQAGNYAVARKYFQKILDENPAQSDALYLSGVIANEEGRREQAFDLVTRAIASDPTVASFHLTLADVHGALGRGQDAVASYRRAIALDPDDPQSRTGLGCALLDSGDHKQALEHLQNAVRLVPGIALTHHNLGVALQALGRTEDAASSYRQALHLDPGHAQAGCNLGAVLHAQGKMDDAIACFRQTLDRSPNFAQAWSNLGVALQADHRVDEAESCLLRAVSLNPQDFNAYSKLALCQREQGKVEASAASSERAIAVRDSVGERIRLATVLPVVARSASEIQSWRARFDSGVGDVMSRGGVVSDPLREIGVCNFNLAYQPECDRALQEKAAQMYLAVCPTLSYTAAHCRRSYVRKDGRIRIGFISKFMHNHSIGRTTRGLLVNVDSKRFHVTALFVPPWVDDATAQAICEGAENHLVLPSGLEDAQEKIAALELDILFYQDIGMDAYTYFLAFSRLAPVQCVSFGHPDTTGIPTMDYWVSSENFEPAGASAHYSEKLFQLRNLGSLAYYYRPRLRDPAKRASTFGLAGDRNTYLCPQSLFKIHPDFDLVLAGILRGDPLGEIVLIEARSSSWGDVLRQRFQTSMPDVAERVRFLPGMGTDDFLALIAACDVMLDTIYFNGMNTSLEALAVGTPVVTMPTALQRGRHTSGMYKRMGMDECVASAPEQYVSIALRLGTDRKFREEMKEKILARSAVLYEDMDVVREFERFFVEAHHQAARPLPSSIPDPSHSGAGKGALFLVSSAIHVSHGIYSASQRLGQTMDTCESILRMCPHATIAVLDGGTKKLSPEEKDALNEYVSSLFEFSGHEEVQRIQGIDSQDLVKNSVEIFMYKTFFGEALNGSFDMTGFSRVVKVSGRYSLNSGFDYELHKNAVNKIVMGESHASQFKPELTGNIFRQYMSRLWSFDAALLPEISKCYENMWKHMNERAGAGGYVDIEHLLYHHLDREKVLTVKRVGIQGAIAPNGKVISE
jgi:protein O-GlcNAc transferase